MTSIDWRASNEMVSQFSVVSHENNITEQRQGCKLFTHTQIRPANFKNTRRDLVHYPPNLPNAIFVHADKCSIHMHKISI